MIRFSCPTWFQISFPEVFNVIFYFDAGHIQIETGDGYSTLTITGIETLEAGKYRIEVENQAGSASTEFQVVVKCEY